MLRALIISALMGATVSAQEVVALNSSAQLLADHDGVDTTSYRLNINGKDMPAQDAASVWADGTVTFDLRVIAVNDASEAASDPFTVAIVQPTPPPPAPLMACPYVNQQGVLTPKEIGDDSVRGWNVMDSTKLADVQKTYARKKQLTGWGLDYQVLAVDDGQHLFHDGVPRIYIYAPCTGYRAPQ